MDVDYKELCGIPVGLHDFGRAVVRTVVARRLEMDRQTSLPDEPMEVYMEKKQCEIGEDVQVHIDRGFNRTVCD